MKKLSLLLFVLAITMTARAQYYQYKPTPFHQDKVFFGASVTGFDLHYNSTEELTFGVDATAGYFVADDCMLSAQVGFNTNGKASNSLILGLGARYYIEQNGLFLGAKLNYEHLNKNYDDFVPGIEVGYAFFLSRTVTIEPALYYNISTKDFSDRSTFGLKVGFGIYLND